MSTRPRTRVKGVKYRTIGDDMRAIKRTGQNLARGTYNTINKIGTGITKLKMPSRTTLPRSGARARMRSRKP